MSPKRKEEKMDTEEKIATRTVGDIEERPARINARNVAVSFGGGVMYAIIGVLLGICGVPFGAYPFGIALLSAADRKVLYIFLGVCTSALVFSQQPILFLSAYAAVLLIRTTARVTLDPPKRDGSARAFFASATSFQA